MLLKNNKIYILIITLLVLILSPENYFLVFDSFKVIIKFVSFLSILYLLQFGMNKLYMLIILCIIAFNYKLISVCKNNVTPILKPFGQKGMFYNLDISNKFLNSTDTINYDIFFKNLKNDERNGKHQPNNIIPKHHNFNNTTTLDRLLKMESEITTTKCNEESYINWDKNWFKYLQS